MCVCVRESVCNYNRGGLNSIRMLSKLLVITDTYSMYLNYGSATKTYPGHIRHTSLIFLALKAGDTVCLADLHSSPVPKTKPKYVLPLAFTGSKLPLFCVKTEAQMINI